MQCNTPAYVVLKLSTSVRLFTVLLVFVIWHISRNGKVDGLLLWSIISVWSRLNLCVYCTECIIRAVVDSAKAVVAVVVFVFTSFNILSNLFMFDLCPLSLLRRLFRVIPM